MLKRLLLSLCAAAALLMPAYGQVAVDTSKTQTGQSAVLLGASGAAVILPSSGSSNASGQITFTTALPATPVGTVGVFLPSGVVTAGAQGTGAAVYQATCSSTTVCTLTGTVTTANAAYTQTTGEVALSTLTVPGGAMGLNGGLESRTIWTFPNNANSKTLRVRLGGIGGTAYLAVVAGTNVNVNQITKIRNRGAANLQVGSPATLAGGIGSSGAANTVSAVDTSVAVDLVTSGQLGVATDYLILESRETWLLP